MGSVYACAHMRVCEYYCGLTTEKANRPQSKFTVKIKKIFHTIDEFCSTPLRAPNWKTQSIGLKFSSYT